MPLHLKLEIVFRLWYKTKWLQCHHSNQQPIGFRSPAHGIVTTWKSAFFHTTHDSAYASVYWCYVKSSKGGTNNQIDANGMFLGSIRITCKRFIKLTRFFAFKFVPFYSPIGKRDRPLRCFQYRYLPMWTADQNGVRRVETIFAISRYLRMWVWNLFELTIFGWKVGRKWSQTLVHERQYN